MASFIGTLLGKFLIGAAAGAGASAGVRAIAGGGGRGGRVPAVPPGPATAEFPTKATAAKGAARETEAAKRRRGRTSTIVTGPSGLTEEPLLGRKTLLGQ